MRHAIFALILLAAPASSAQTSRDGEAAWNEVQQRSAEIANMQNCQVACRALESLSRATKRLCDIGPEHCEEAKAKLRDAEQRVRTTCPECDVKTGAAHMQTQEPPAPPQAYGGGHSADAVSAQETSKRGGCAGCSSAPEPVGFGAGALILLAAVRRKRRPR